MERNKCQTCFGDPRVRANPALRRSPSRRNQKGKLMLVMLMLTLGVKRKICLTLFILLSSYRCLGLKKKILMV